MIGQQRRHLSVLLLLIMLLATHVRGDMVTFAFTGVTTVFTDGDGVGWSIPNGTALSGTFTFDSSVPDSSPDDPEYGRYYNTITDLSLQLNGYAALHTTGISNHIYVLNDPINDQYILLDRELEYRGYPTNFSFLFADEQSSVFDDIALPVSPPPVNEFEYTGFILRGDDDQFGVNGVVTSLTLVPEPSTLLLLVGATLLARRPRC